MDPDACLQATLTALAEEEGTEAIEGLRNLAEWIAKGGFFPEIEQCVVSDLNQDAEVWVTK